MYILVTLAAVAASGMLSAQSKELPPEWEVRKSMEELAAQVKRLEPILVQVKPQDWVSKGAPEAYVRQWKSSQAELKYLVGATEKLAKQPDKLPIALETLFRMESLHVLTSSLAEGIRRYQNPALGDLLQSVVNEGSANKESLKQYIVDLAEVREKEFQMVDSEAQRCRGVLSRQAPAAPAKKAAESKAVAK